jgi:hypothetical protein
VSARAEIWCGHPQNSHLALRNSGAGLLSITNNVVFVTLSTFSFRAPGIDDPAAVTLRARAFGEGGDLEPNAAPQYYSSSSAEAFHCLCQHLVRRNKLAFGNFSRLFAAEILLLRS